MPVKHTILCFPTFYPTGEQGFYPVTNFMKMEDVSFNDGKTAGIIAAMSPACAHS